jgi:glycosyltransferase involved in cell wall biosynthesis
MCAVQHQDATNGEAGTGPAVSVAYTLEQCWHPTPGGTAVAALRIADALQRCGDVELHFVAGKHPRPPAPPYRPSGAVHMLPLTRPLLYESWVRLNWPKVESVTGPVDVAHATGLVPCATDVPLVVTVHDLAFVHEPGQFSRQGARIMTRSLRAIERRAARIVCSSTATMADCRAVGLPGDSLRVVPLGVDPVDVLPNDLARVRRRYALPAEFVLFVGTLEPRKNLRRLVEACSGTSLPLIVAGADGWGDLGVIAGGDTRFVGFVPPEDLPALYAAATVFAYPSEREGFGLPVAEAMAQGTPVVTSTGTSTEEVAGGAGVLVDPFDVASITAGIVEAFDRRHELEALGRARAGQLTWAASAAATTAVYRELV